MFPPKVVYPKAPNRISVLFDTEAPGARSALTLLKESFGNGYSDTETLYPPRHMCLHLYPGGLLRPAA